MFKCNNCNRNTKSGEPCHVLPVEIREKSYQTRKGITFGWEIAKSAKFCSDCAEEHHIEIPEKKKSSSQTYIGVNNPVKFGFEKRWERNRPPERKKKFD